MIGSSELPAPPDPVAPGIVAAIRNRVDLAPSAGLVLGSGLGETIRIARELTHAGEGDEFSYSDLPGFPPSSAPGHAGRLWIGELRGKVVAVFQGRIHYYEGHGMSLSSLPTQVAAGLGANAIVLTAAVGSVDPTVESGTLVVVRDHLNFMGTSPLVGWRTPDGAPAFVDAERIYDAGLSGTALAAARSYFQLRASASGSAVRLPVAEGVYAAVPGPSFETPAETEFLRRAGATVVGMSMVPEAVAARALRMRVLGLSFVTNAAGTAVSHGDVLIASKTAAEVMAHVVVEVLEEL